MPESITKPSDIRSLSARYPGRCYVCNTPISIGDSCFYSPSVKKIGCSECWGAPAKTGFKNQKNRSERESETQIQWRRYCSYLKTCLIAEAGESIVDFSSDECPTLAGTEQLFSTSATTISLDGPIVSGKLARVRNIGTRDFLYGWPTVIVNVAGGKSKVAPLFVVTCDGERDSTTGVWTITPKSDPDLNIALLSSRIFEPAVAAEVDASVEGTISFGNRSQLRRQIAVIASTLGLDCHGFEHATLQTTYPGVPGVYNCALLLDANDNGANRDLLRELEILGTKTDWVETAAASLISGERRTKSTNAGAKASPVCGPLILNRTQEESTDASRRNQVTVITGPPGTGKSQLVVSAVANAWLDQESVLVTSTNNGAVDVAVARANEIANGLLIRTGNRAARDSLPSLVAEVILQYKNLQPNMPSDEGIIRSRLALAQMNRASLHGYLSDAERWDNELTTLVAQIDHLSVILWGNSRSLGDIDQNRTIATDIKRLSRAFFFRRFRQGRLYQRLKITFNDANVEYGKEWSSAVLEYPGKRARIEILRLQKLIDPDQQLQDTDNEWVIASKSAVDFSIRNSIQKNPAAYTPIGNASGGGGKLVTATALAKRALKGWACTTLSMNRNFSLDAGFFDLAIIDEASQCNIAHILPIAYRAKRLLVVGDPNQLPPIVQVGRRTVDSIAEICEIREILNANSGLDFLDGSAYFGFEKSIGIENVILLNEHYRCHPRIARWFNEAFYGGSLAVMTDISAMQNGDRGISWIDVAGQSKRPSNQRSWINTAEITEATKIVREALSQELTIGVVSPFAAQAAAIARTVESEFGAELLAEARFISGTAHRFQGDERDIMVFSSCVAPGILEHSAKWVEKERNLINVAVSRARQRLVVLGHPMIESLKCPTLTSLRSFVLEISAGDGKVAHRVDSESETRLLKAMIIGGLAPLAKVDVEGFELDFAILNGSRKLDIEVDGDQHFDIKLQRCRQDILRDRVLARVGWEVLRFPAWQCFVEPENIVAEISSHLK